MIIKCESAYIMPSEIKSINVTELDKNFNIKIIYKNIDFVKIIKKKYKDTISLAKIQETILKETKKNKSITFTINISFFGIKENFYIGAEGEHAQIF